MMRNTGGRGSDNSSRSRLGGMVPGSSSAVAWWSFV